MTDEPATRIAGPGSTRHDAGGVGIDDDPASSPLEEAVPEATAGMVLHRVLAESARTFLLNDMTSGFDGGSTRRGPATSPLIGLHAPDRPLWAESVTKVAGKTGRMATVSEQIHQSRVALRRIRSNLRTFRLLLDPTWGTSLRAELSWYGDELGRLRDLDIIRDAVCTTGAGLVGPDILTALTAALGQQRTQVDAALRVERAGARRFQLTEQMMVLWDGPSFSEKAARPAADVLPVMLHRAWHDLRGAARSARKDSTDANLHRLRIRLKDLRYGCDTVALVQGGPARKTAKAAERLQSKLGDLHDVSFVVDWLLAVGDEHTELIEPVKELIAAEYEIADATRKGWKRDLKEIERRWRSWQG